MDELLNIKEFLDINTPKIQPVVMIFNFILTVIMSFITRKFYLTYSNSINGKMYVANVLPILSCIIFTVIVIIKSSLALSLGLVGALSIVRFRTPIKEPEELVYLFLYKKMKHNGSEYNLCIDLNNNSFDFNKLTKILSKFGNQLKLIKLDIRETSHTAILEIELNEKTTINTVINELKNEDKTIEISIFEARNSW